MRKIGRKPFPWAAEHFADVLFHEWVHAIPNLSFSELLWVFLIWMVHLNSQALGLGFYSHGLLCPDHSNSKWIIISIQSSCKGFFYICNVFFMEILINANKGGSHSLHYSVCYDITRYLLTLVMKIHFSLWLLRSFEFLMCIKCYGKPLCSWYCKYSHFIRPFSIAIK